MTMMKYPQTAAGIGQPAYHESAQMELDVSRLSWCI